jgi:pimeloyl-ACP methyl ester carboxylesterase
VFDETKAGLRAFEVIREEIAKRYQFIGYTQRYFGTDAWPDEGKNFNVPTHADGLITSLNVGPVHLVGRSYGGVVAMTAALRNPALVRTHAIHEPPLISVHPEDSVEGNAAREDWAKIVALAIAANQAGDPLQATRLFIEGVFQLGAGGFDHLPQVAVIAGIEPGFQSDPWR